MSDNTANISVADAVLASDSTAKRLTGDERRGAQGKIAQASLPERKDSFADPECGHRHEEIIGDLRVVGADFERRRERRER